MTTRTGMQRQASAPAVPSKELLLTIQRFRYDFLALVMFMFPWGEAGSALESEPGPDHWQVDALDTVSGLLKEMAEQPPEEMLPALFAAGSGHGSGKTAFAAWVIISFMLTRWEMSGVVTANTATQLSTKTMRELRRWVALCKLHHWFDVQATSLRLKWVDTCQTDAIPWSKERPEAVAGTHAPSVLLIMDESSAIDNAIWETVEGAGLTGEKLWICLGNRTRNTGRFNDCFGKFAHRWHTMTIDSRDTRKAKKAEIQQWVDDWGEESDFIRVRVRGLPPKASSTQLIPIDLIKTARQCRPKVLDHLPQIMGVDVAKFGDDHSVIYRRTGLASLSLERFSGIDEVMLAEEVGERIEKYEPDAVFVDGHGIGSGVISILKHRGYDVISATVGDAARVPSNFNRRADCYRDLKQWLADGAGIPDEQWLEDELLSIDYTFKGDKLQIVPKEVMKSLGIASPDGVDSIALTFYQPVRKRDDKQRYRPVRAQVSHEWNVLGMN